MIIVGYQGIGKSTVASADNRIIDLESSNFRVEGEPRPENWYKMYVQTALHLSNQGYKVLVSAHKVVRDYMKECNIPFCVICPSPKLKTLWTQRLANRFAKDPSEKNRAALTMSLSSYDSNVRELLAEQYCVVIKDDNYDLNETLSRIDYFTEGKAWFELTREEQLKLCSLIGCEGGCHWNCQEKLFKHN